MPVASSLQSLSHLRCCMGFEHGQVLHMRCGKLTAVGRAAEEAKMRMMKGEDWNSPRLEKGPMLFPAKSFPRACPHHPLGRNSIQKEGPGGRMKPEGFWKWKQEEQSWGWGEAALVLVAELRVCSQRRGTAQGSLRRSHRGEAATARSWNEQRVKWR